MRNQGLICEEAEVTLSDPSTWATYAAWIIGGAGLGIVRNKVMGNGEIFISNYQTFSQSKMKQQMLLLI